MKENVSRGAVWLVSLLRSFFPGGAENEPAWGFRLKAEGSERGSVVLSNPESRHPTLTKKSLKAVVTAQCVPQRSPNYWEGVGGLQAQRDHSNHYKACGWPIVARCAGAAANQIQLQFLISRRSHTHAQRQSQSTVTISLNDGCILSLVGPCPLRLLPGVQAQSTSTRCSGYPGHHRA